MIETSRRGVLGMGAAAAGGAMLPATAVAGRAAAPFRPTWESLIEGYTAPDWFRDAKLGFWAHWGLQCIPSAGNWYGRDMYIQGSRSSDHHRATYGHPSKTGYMDIIPTWKVDAWDPDRLVGLYKEAGGKYFVALSCHHDNFDNWDSSHHPWNSVRFGPKQDLVAGWRKAARRHGLRFGVSDHSAHSWHWFRTAYGYDLEGPMKGRRYDAATLTAAQGRGRWWEGLDPQTFYNGRSMAMPDGIGSIAEANLWHNQHDGEWTEIAPPMNPAFTRRWLARCTELVTKYEPDLCYFDNFDLPLQQAGLDFTAAFYNANMARNGGRLDAVVNAKMIPPHRRKGIVEDVERGGKEAIALHPWQTDTCIGDWFYDKGVYERGDYKSARTVLHNLCDIVSKNGNLLLSIPVRADGSIDEKEEAIVADIGRWMSAHGGAIYGTRPWRLHGEGPGRTGGGMFNEAQKTPFDARDVRYTIKGRTLHAIALGWPADGVIRMTLLGSGNPVGRGEVRRVTLVRDGTPLRFSRTSDALTVTLPPGARDEIGVAIAIDGPGLTA